MFVELLDDLLEEGKVREYVAVAIVGYCGLRPSELATLHQVQGCQHQAEHETDEASAGSQGHYSPGNQGAKP